LGRNPKRILDSGEFRTQFGRFPKVKNTGWPEDFPSPSKVVASEYKIMDNKWFKGGRSFSVFNHQLPSYGSPNILSFLLSWENFRPPLWTKFSATFDRCKRAWIARKIGR